MISDSAKTEAIQIGIYCDVICNLLNSHKNLSVIKTTVFSYIIKQNNLLNNNCFNAKNTKSLVFKSLSLLAGNYQSLCDNTPYILKAIDLLIKNNLVIYDNNELTYVEKGYKVSNIYYESNFLKKAIEESYTMSDTQFIKEVMYNV